MPLQKTADDDELMIDFLAVDGYDFIRFLKQR